MGSAARRNNVVESGVPDGRPIVFAHGYGCDHGMWRLITPQFARDHRVIVFDHVGFGGSDLSQWSAEQYGTLAPYADDLLALLDELDLQDVVFVGHSVASMIGVLAAGKDSSRFGQLILIGPSARYIDDPDAGYTGGFAAADIEDLIATLDSNHLGWSRAMAPVIMGRPDHPEFAEELAESFCRTDPAIASAFARATFLGDNRADLDAVTVPTLVMQCAEDSIAPVVVGRYVHEHIRDSEFVQLEATGHCPNLSAPEETAAVIRAHLKRHDHVG